MKDNNYIKGFIAGVVTVVVIALAAFLGFNAVKMVIYGTKSDNTLTINTDRVSEKLKKIEEVINSQFMGEIDNDLVEDYLYKGMIVGLNDRYAMYYNEDEYKRYQSETKGVYSGIGITFGGETDDIKTISGVFEGSPAEEAGIKADDVIMSINGVDVKGISTSDVVKLIQTTDDKIVKLHIYRPSEDKYFDCETRIEEVETITVHYEMLESEIGYINISSFEGVTLKQFEEAMDYLEQNNMKGLIIDLRDNPGGLVISVTKIADELLPEGVVVYTEDKYGNRKEYESDADSRLNVPFAVLVNENSASAAEIFAGAVKDFKAGTIIGTQTFGKGIVQNIVPLNDGSAVKLTVANYFTPNGNNIHKIGIEPDIEVENVEEQLNKAVEVIKEKIQ